jgi:anti-sigma B factor antagonist
MAVEIIHLKGPIRMGDAVDNLRAAMDSHLKQGTPHMVVDMQSVTTLDSSAIGVLVRGLSLAKQQGGVVKLAAVPAAALQTLQVTGVARLFEIFGDEPSASASFDVV